MISLDEYVENMKPEQKAIYFIASDSITSAKNAPFLEKMLEKGLEVCVVLLNGATFCSSLLIFLLAQR